MNKIDELFRNNLKNRSELPTAQAWERIERSLEKKNKQLVWWHAAAAILLVSVVSWWTYTWQSRLKNSHTLAINKKESDTRPTRPNVKPKAYTPQPAATQRLTKQRGFTDTGLTKAAIQPFANKQETDPTREERLTVNIPEVPSVVQETVPELTTETVVTHVEKPIVLEFTLEPVTTEAVATARSERRSIRSVLMDLKNGESYINLQTLKENLFAFNQKKSKPIETKE